jgi:hypothetical protein
MKRLLLLSTLLLNTIVYGGLKKPLTMSSVGIGFSVGLSSMNTQAFNVYTPKQMPKFKQSQILIGAEGFGSFKRCIIGFSANLAKGDKMQNDTYAYSLSGGSLSFNWAYKINTQAQWLVFPMISAGVSAYGIGIDRKITPNQSEMVTYSNRSLNIRNAGVTTDISMNIFRLCPASTQKHNNKQHQPALGLKLGYTYGFKNSSWTYTGGSVTEGPKFGVRMVYLKLIIGGISHTSIKL